LSAVAPDYYARLPKPRVGGAALAAVQDDAPDAHRRL
jgi:hypothetical protein